MRKSYEGRVNPEGLASGETLGKKTTRVPFFSETLAGSESLANLTGGTPALRSFRP